jgi:hypothetical protein
MTYDDLLTDLPDLGLPSLVGAARRGLEMFGSLVDERPNRIFISEQRAENEAIVTSIFVFSETFLSEVKHPLDEARTSIDLLVYRNAVRYAEYTPGTKGPGRASILQAHFLASPYIYMTASGDNCDRLAAVAKLLTRSLEVIR